MSQFYSGADLKRGVLQRCGEPTDGSSDYDGLVMKYLNQLYFNIIAGSSEFDVDCGEADWMWARATAPMILTLQPSYTAGSVSVTQNSTACSFSIPPATSMKGQYLKMADSDNPERYRIIEHIAGDTSFTLDGPFNGSTNSTASFFVTILVYTLGTQDQILRLVEPFRVYFMSWDEDRNYQIYGIDSNSFNRDYPLSSIVGGVPNRFMDFIDDDGNVSVRMNQYVGQTMRVEVDWVPVPMPLEDSDSSIPIVPRAFRIALEYGATALLMMDKNDNRAANFFQLTTAKLKALVEAGRKEKSHVNSKSKGAIQPRQEYLRVRERLQSYVRQQ